MQKNTQLKYNFWVVTPVSRFTDNNQILASRWTIRSSLCMCIGLLTSVCGSSLKLDGIVRGMMDVDSLYSSIILTSSMSPETGVTTVWGFFNKVCNDTFHRVQCFCSFYEVLWLREGLVLKLQLLLPRARTWFDTQVKLYRLAQILLMRMSHILRKLFTRLQSNCIPTCVIVENPSS